MKAKISGEGWARVALAGGAAFSVAGNVTHTVMLISSISLGLRIPFAVIWPLALFVAVEVLVRVPWRRKFLDVLGRIVLILPVSAVAAVVSYRHLHHLMVLAGEDGFSNMIGPLAIDGLMLGGTVALLTIRAVRLLADPSEEHEEEMSVAEERIPVSAIGQGTSVSELAEKLEQMRERAEQGDNPMWSGSNTPEQVAERKTRTRTGKSEQRKAIELLLNGRPVKEVAEELNMGRATVGRYNTAINRLRNDPNADVSDIRGIPADLLAVIRDNANRERVL
jgi:hypothetical protein